MEQPMDQMTGELSETGATKGPRREHIGRRTAFWLAWSLWLLVILLNVLGFGLKLANDSLSTREWLGHHLTAAPFLAFATVGAVIITRRAGNRIGWLCWAIGFTFIFSFLGSPDVWAALAANEHRSSTWALLPLLANIAWLGTLLGLLPFLILLFPTGRLLSRRWRPVAWALGLVVGLYLSARLLTPGPIDPRLAGNPQNPLGVESAEGLLQLVQTLSGVAAPILILAVLASVVVRFRRARGEERQQLKWFTVAVAAELVLTPGLGAVAEQVAPVLGELVVFPVSLSLIPIAIGIAVLKYRLYDIDRIINRTLVYGLLTVLLGAIYTAGVFGLGQLLNPVTGESALAVAASTLAVAALFQPARRRIQTTVDRRFNRRKYNAATTIQAFSTRLRDQVDLDTLASELLAVVDQTMEPTLVWVWLRPSSPSSSGTLGNQARPAPWVY
jgi:hypothetical protein